MEAERMKEKAVKTADDRHMIRTGDVDSEIMLTFGFWDLAPVGSQKSRGSVQV